MMNTIKNFVPSVAFIVKALLVITLDKKLRVTDRVAAMIPFGL